MRGRLKTAILLLHPYTYNLNLFLENQRDELFSQMTKNMPAYQRPVFIRVQPEIEMTGTFKFRKVELVKEGYDVTKFEDGVSSYFYSKQEKSFIPLTIEMVRKIDSGELKF